MHPYFEIFGFSLPAYGLMSVVGCLAAAVYLFLSNRGGKGGRLPNGDLVNIGTMAVVGALVGGQVLYSLTMIPVAVRHWAVLAENPLALLGLFFGGLVFYGGFIGGFLAVAWYCRRYAISLKTVLGLLTPAVPLFHVFGRVGCFLGGCCWGMQVPWGVVYTNSIAAPNGVPLLPIQLIEAGCNLVLFVVLAVAARRLREAWLVFPLYLALYGCLRFALEFFRADRLRGVFWLSTSQWISLVLVLAATVWMLAYYAKRRRAPNERQGECAKSAIDGKT